MEFTKLSRKHGFKISAGFQCSVEECSLAVGEVIGHSSIKSAARMNGAVVIFVDSIDKVNKVIETGIIINDTFVAVSPLTTPAKQITISNIPPFISDDVLIRELTRHGKIVSKIRKLPSGCRSPLLKHVVSHRRQVLMILNKKDEELNLVFNVKVEDFDYVVFVNSGTLKCFGCGKEGHLVRACPDKISTAEKSEKQAEKQAEETEKTQQNTENTQDEVAVSQTEENKSDDGESAAGGELAELNTVNTAAADTVRDSEEEMLEENDLKVPVLKRKNKNSDSGSKAKKGAASVREKQKEVQQNSESSMEEEEVEEEEEDCAEGSQPYTDSQLSVGSQQEEKYEVQQVKNFLKKTKNMKNVRIEDYFADSKMFLRSVRTQMNSSGNGGYTRQEVYRLKKFVGKLLKIYNDGDSEAV